MRDEEIEREIRRKNADWDFINKQPPKLRQALILFIETGSSFVHFHLETFWYLDY